MTALVWDQVGERRYETGIDRGVLYPPTGPGVPWNGLTNVTENETSQVKPYYIDGMKFLDKHVPGSYSAKLSAFTYPDILDDLTGSPEYAPGVRIHDQSAKLFHLSYRSKVGNDTDGIEHGYKLHVVYHVLAKPSGASYDSVAGDISVKPFDFDLTGTPQSIFGIRPTSHVSIDSRHIDPTMLVTIEGLLYGTDEIDPQVPELLALLTMVAP
jgi:hypothetical protein